MSEGNYAPRVPPRKGAMFLTEAQKAAHIDHTRKGLIDYLTPRRERLGQTEQDIRESPEGVLRKKTELQKKQQALLDEYLQSQVSVDTM